MTKGHYMRKNGRGNAVGLIVLAVLVLIVCTCEKKVQLLTLDDARFAEGKITGTLIDNKGNPIAGGMVTAQPSGKTTVTDKYGNFTLSGVKDEQVFLVFRSPDYFEASSAPIVLRMGENKQLSNVGQLVSRFGWLKGTVLVDVSLDDDSTALAGVQVVDQPAMTYTYVDGKFSAMKVEPGHLKVYGVKRGVGYGVAWTQVVAGDTASSSVLINHRGGKVKGTVVTASAASASAAYHAAGFVPVKDAVVSAIGGIIADTTDAQGKFLLTEVPTDGTVTITIIKGNRLLMVTGVVAIEGGTVDLDTLALGTAVPTNGLLVLPGIVNGFLGDSITVPAGVSGDSARAVDCYKWKKGADTAWSTTPYPSKKFLFASAGVDSVKVKAVLMNGLESNVALIKVVVAPLDAPQIAASPVSQACKADSAVLFAVAIKNGGGKYVYAWQHRRVAAGTGGFRWDVIDTSESIAARDSISIVANKGSAGWYRVVVRNAKGACTSDSALLSLLEPPAIVVQPVSQTGSLSESITLTAEVSGSAPFTYTWYCNSAVRNTFANVPETVSSCSIVALSPADTGRWTCTVSNSVGSATTDTARIGLKIVGNHNVTASVNDPALGRILPGGSISIPDQGSQIFALVPEKGCVVDSVTVNGTKDTSAHAGDTLYNLTGVTSDKSVKAWFTRKVFAPGIASHPKSTLVPASGPVKIGAAVTGTAPFDYVWKLNGKPRRTILKSALYSDSVAIASLTPLDTGIWTCEASNIAGSAVTLGAHVAFSGPITLTVSATNGGTIAKNPDRPSYNFGDSVKISVTGNNATPPIHFRKFSGDVASKRDTFAFSFDTVVVMTASKAVTANFGYYINAVGVNGSVTKSIDQPLYLGSAAVQLTAVPRAGYRFLKWNGGNHNNPAVVRVSIQGTPFDRNDTAYCIVDDGSTVTPRAMNGLVNLKAVGFADAQNGIVLGDSLAVRGIGFSTVNGGATWSSETFRSARPLLAVCRPVPTVWVGVGDSGSIAHKRTGLSYWSAPSSPLRVPFHGVAFCTAANGFAVGDNAAIIQTVDTGKSWTAVTSNATGNFAAISFFSAQAGVIAGSGGRAYRFVYNGNLWQTTLGTGIPTSVDCFGVCAFGTINAVTVGALGAVYYSSNSGASWTRAQSPVTQTLRAVTLAGGARNILIAVGDYGTVIKSVDNGKNWAEMASGTNVSLRAVSPAGSNGFVAAGDGGIVLFYTLP